MDKLVSWRDIPELRTYAGIARYETSFDLPPEFLRDDVALLLELGEVYELADVWLNGRHVATSWFPPHGLDLTGHRPAGSEYAPHRRAQHPQEPLGARRLCPALGPAGAGADPARRASLPAGDHTMTASLSTSARLAVLLAAIAGLLFDGVELGLMPVASLSVSQSLLGADYTKTLGGDWFARFTAALMLGAAVGGIALGNLGDVVGRTRRWGSASCSTPLFAGLGALVRTQEQMLVLRFLVGLGVGGVWPNAVALAAECWPDRSRPVVAGLMGAALNGGILMLSQIARIWHITPDSWRWIFWLAAAPAVLGVLVLVAAAGIAAMAGQPSRRRASPPPRSASSFGRRCCG